jgi:hypothetical protein
MTQCTLVVNYHHLEGNCYLSFQIDKIKQKVKGKVVHVLN